MPEASPSSKLVEFKGGKLSVMNAFLRETDAMKLADALHVMLGGMPISSAARPPCSISGTSPSPLTASTGPRC